MSCNVIPSASAVCEYTALPVASGQAVVSMTTTHFSQSAISTYKVTIAAEVHRLMRPMRVVAIQTDPVPSASLVVEGRRCTLWLSSGAAILSGAMTTL